MRSQDIGLLLKLVSLESVYAKSMSQLRDMSSLPYDWEGWEVDPATPEFDLFADDMGIEGRLESYSVRSLATETGISKSQVSLSINRILDVGLAVRDQSHGYPKVNRKALYEFIVYGLRYVFPARPGSLTRGIATSVGAPVFKHKLMTAGDSVPVWPDARGKTKGVAVEPLFKSATHAVRLDSKMYAMLSLVDAIRIGSARERKVAVQLLAVFLEVKHD